MKCQVIGCEEKAAYKSSYEGSCGKPEVEVLLCKEHLLTMYHIPHYVSHSAILKQHSIKDK